MKKISFLILILVLFLIVKVFAEGSIKAEVDKMSLTTNDTLSYKLTSIVFGSELPQVQLPKFEGFNVLSSMQSSTMSFAKNKIKRVMVYEFILSPKNVGRLEIESATVKIENEVFSSDSFEIEVKPGMESSPKTSL